MLEAQALADRYVAAWNEPDATKRLEAIAALWAPGASRRGFGALGKLILGSSERNGGRDGVRFRAAPSARRRRDVVTFRWDWPAARPFSQADLSFWSSTTRAGSWSTIRSSPRSAAGHALLPPAHWTPLFIEENSYALHYGERRR
jgi:hypothetical protein